MKSYQEALNKLGNRDSKKLENNTYLLREKDSLAVRLHQTDIVRYFPSGDIQLDTGGWRTVTTKDRLNKYAPVNIWTDRGIWYVAPVGSRTWDEREAAACYFDDLMTIKPNGTFTGVKTITQAKAENKLRAQVRKYAKNYTAALVAGKIPLPSSGDCWYCALHEVKTGKPLGELTRSKNGHITGHLKEKYYVPSLAVNALKAMGGSHAATETLYSLMGHPQAHNWKSDWIVEQIQKAIRRYVYRELGLAY